MKKLKVILALAVTGFFTMSMGFPTDLANSSTTVESEKLNSRLAIVSNVVVMTKAEIGRKNITKEPLQSLSFSHHSSTAITVKVFDAKGTMVMMQKISKDDFLANSEKLSLPKGSTFVMLHESTAYYFLEADLVN